MSKTITKVAQNKLIIKISQTCFPLKWYHFVCLQEIQSFICVLLVITVMVCLAVTSMEGQDPGHVLFTHIGIPLEQEARASVCPALLVRTVTAQVWHAASYTLELNILIKSTS